MQTIDIPRTVSVYPSRPYGERWWTKAWFNGRKEGETSVEIEERNEVIRFLHDETTKDEWLAKYYPKQMEVLYAALEQTREQVINQYKQAIS